MRKLRKWRVEITHVNGYTAPSIPVWTEGDRLWKAKANAIEIARSQSRLADFTQYTFQAIHLNPDDEPDQGVSAP
jgi:hypothetical protein